MEEGPSEDVMDDNVLKSLCGDLEISSERVLEETELIQDGIQDNSQMDKDEERNKAEVEEGTETGNKD